ncbi:AraC family transcriptional regulator [Phenylobacterium sp.]|uniref:AraC family transcriptional regulator n=1 Tax=Phenylobacterium sp. TaxID=1871053 RepID=UPI0035AE4509
MDPLAEVVALLQPGAPFSKRVVGAGRWRARRSEPGRPFYCVVVSGACRLAVQGQEPLILEEGDFVLIPEVKDFETCSLDPPPPEVESTPEQAPSGEFRMGAPGLEPDVRLLIGYCEFGSPDTALLLSLMPQLVRVRGEDRLGALVRLVAEEAWAQRPARDMILARLLEVLLIEALRASDGTAASPGLVRGLADRQLAAAIRRMHEEPTRSWTVAELAKVAALSRSTFFERFTRAVGLAPMEYLLAWRMALAKDRLRRGQGGVAEVAEAVGYSSASAFSTAFARRVGVPPARYARERAAV